MGKKSKFFRAFVEGQTISDNRTVTAEMIDDIVATFNTESYTPRINVEHISGYSPEPPFNGYGDVTAVKAQTDTITIDGKPQQRRALYAQVDANDQLVTLSERNQKPFPSVELTPNYAGTGKFGLIGLAFTDTPASIATQRLNFSRVNGNVIATADDRAALEFEAGPADANGIAAAVVQGLTGFFSKFKPEGQPAPKKDEQQLPANDNVFDPAAFATAIGGIVAAAIKPVVDAQTQHASDFTALRAKLESTDANQGFSRPPATGGSIDPKLATDC
ncbi:GPO family capsid scaffolding protein [Sphingomonas aracearum]|uniref:Phage capsid protein n=1 Tax=Sphingomonas aracearum TaxID=2283317 RepID=A0A369VXY9_9SPHN|nr:GPO family capsid scaffolding protein [Sphingomonas aracearum]RDE04701.1 phage capsid protein [Sphingomonas aracearum]